jgi:hypothetical protein
MAAISGESARSGRVGTGSLLNHNNNGPTAQRRLGLEDRRAHHPRSPPSRFRTITFWVTQKALRAATHPAHCALIVPPGPVRPRLRDCTRPPLRRRLRRPPRSIRRALHCSQAHDAHRSDVQFVSRQSNSQTAIASGMSWMSWSIRNRQPRSKMLASGLSRGDEDRAHVPRDYRKRKAQNQLAKNPENATRRDRCSTLCLLIFRASQPPLNGHSVTPASCAIFLMRKPP